jgi:hypothetical protein
LKETIKKKHLLENMKVVNFLIECINPILVNGILEIMKKMPSDPTDFLASNFCLNIIKVTTLFCVPTILTDSIKILGRIYLQP